VPPPPPHTKVCVWRRREDCGSSSSKCLSVSVCDMGAESRELEMRAPDWGAARAVGVALGVITETFKR
jgi:hypothetical protein